MSVDANQQLIQRLFTEVINNHRFELLDEIFGPSSMIGASFKETMLLMQTAFPNFRATIEHLFGAGDQVAVVFTVTGDNTGEFMGQPPTGKAIVFTGIHYYQIRDGRVYTARYEHDLLGLMEQLDLLPPGSRPNI